MWKRTRAWPDVFPAPARSASGCAGRRTHRFGSRGRWRATRRRSLACTSRQRRSSPPVRGPPLPFPDGSDRRNPRGPWCPTRRPTSRQSPRWRATRTPRRHGSPTRGLRPRRPPPGPATDPGEPGAAAANPARSRRDEVVFAPARYLASPYDPRWSNRPVPRATRRKPWRSTSMARVSPSSASDRPFIMSIACKPPRASPTRSRST